jgi:hypothetical protein
MAASVGTIPGSPAGGERFPGGAMGARRWGTPRGRSMAPAWHMMTGATAPTGGYHSHAMAGADNAAPMMSHTAIMAGPGSSLGMAHVGVA